MEFRDEDMKSLSRREVAKFGTLATASALCESVMADDSEEIIDIHQHINFHARLNDDFVKHQETMGIAKTVLLPSGTALARASTLSLIHI